MICTKRIVTRSFGVIMDIEYWVAWLIPTVASGWAILKAIKRDKLAISREELTLVNEQRASEYDEWTKLMEERKAAHKQDIDTVRKEIKDLKADTQILYKREQACQEIARKQEIKIAQQEVMIDSNIREINLLKRLLEDKGIREPDTGLHTPLQQHPKTSQ